MLKKGLIAVSLVSVMLSCAWAESNNTKQQKQETKKEVKKEAKAEAPKAKKESQESKNDSIEAAKKLLEEMNLEKVYINAVNNSTANLIKANPKFKKVEDKIKAFYEKYIGWNSIKDDLAKLYAKYYTPQELKEITEFYKTKTGKKVLATMGKLSYEGQMITRKRLTPHIDELKKILDEAMAEEEKKESKKEDKKSKKDEPKKGEDKK